MKLQGGKSLPRYITVHLCCCHQASYRRRKSAGQNRNLSAGFSKYQPAKLVKSKQLCLLFFNSHGLLFSTARSTCQQRNLLCLVFESSNTFLTYTWPATLFFVSTLFTTSTTRVQQIVPSVTVLMLTTAHILDQTFRCHTCSHPVFKNITLILFSSSISSVSSMR